MIRRAAVLVLALALFSLTGCDREPTMEESQEERMHAMSGRSYQEPVLVEHPANSSLSETPSIPDTTQPDRP